MVGDARKFDDADAEFFPGLTVSAPRPVDAHDVFALDDDVGEPGHDADDFDAGLFFGERHRVLEEREVAAEFVEDDPLDAAAVAAKQFKGADDGGDRAAAVDVRDEQHGDIGLVRDAHVDDLRGVQVDLRRASRSLADHHLVFFVDEGERLAQGFEPFAHREGAVVVFIAGGVEYFAHQHDLRGGVFARLEQYRVHVGPRFDARRLGLHSLRAPHFEAVGGDAGVVGHVLRFEGADGVSHVGEYAAERGGDEAFARVARCPLYHDAGAVFHNSHLGCCFGQPFPASLILYPAPRGQSVVVVVLYLFHLGDEVGPFDKFRGSAASRQHEFRLFAPRVEEGERLFPGDAAVPHRRHYFVEDQKVGVSPL